MNCLHRLLNHCPNCTEDTDIEHFPNNWNCPRFKPIGMLEVTPKEVKDEHTHQSPPPKAI